MHYIKVKGILLSIMLVTHVKAKEFPLNTMVSVTVSVLQRYQSTCVNLLRARNQLESEYNTTATYLKILTSKHISVTVISIDKIHNHLHERKFGPFYVMLLVDNTFQHNLAKVSEEIKLSKARWLMFLRKTESLEDFFAGIQIPFDCEFLVARLSDTENESSEVTLSEVYHHEDQLQIYHIANWSDANGLIWCSSSFHHRRKNLNGITIKAAVRKEPPYMTFKTTDDNIPVEIQGYVAEIWKEMEKRLNFTTQFRTPEDGMYGNEDINGTWNGMIGMIYTNKAQVGLNAIMQTEERMKAVNYFPTIESMKFVVYIKEPGLEQVTLRDILFPFSSDLWKVLILSALIMTLILSITCYIGMWCGMTNNGETYSLYSSILYLFGMFCQQGHHTTPSFLSSRLVYLTSYLTAVVMFTAYSATFISFLTVRQYEMPFTDFKGMLEDGTYRIGVLTRSANLDHFEKSRNTLLKEVYRRLMEPYKATFPNHHVEGVQKICDEHKYAFITSKKYIQGVLDSLSCKIVEVSQAYYSKPTAMIISKNSHYKRLFSHQLQDMRRTGCFKRIKNNMRLKKIEFLLQDPPPTVTLKMIRILLTILAAGIIMSLLLLMIEFGFYTLRKSTFWFHSHDRIH